MRFTLPAGKSACFPATIPSNPFTSRNQGRSGVHHPRAFVALVSMLLFACTAVLARAQDYTSIVVFGDSLSDTGNVAHLSLEKYGVAIPGPVADYTDGRFTDGADTVPAARNYFGVWIEQLAATLPAHPPVVDSLDGGTNYAYGYATTGKGTAVLTLSTAESLSVTIDNIGLQISNYLATHPHIDNKTLFVVWGGAIDVLQATNSDQVIDAALDQALNIQRLIDAGATRFLVPNLPPLGLVPRLNGSSSTSTPANEATVLYNTVLAASLAIVRDLNFFRRPRLYELDVFSLFYQILAAPSAFDLVNVTSMSQGMVTVDPDTYLFWDDLHPTTRGHNILATTAAELLDPQAVVNHQAKDDRGLITLRPACTDGCAVLPDH